MCGISACIGANAVGNVIAALKALEIRGYDSAGIASWDGTIRVVKGKGYVEDVFATATHTGCMALGHVRWATHGRVSQDNAHPQMDCSGRIAVCHNGVIENCEQLRRALVSCHQFRSETDTEIIAHLLEDSDLATGVIATSDLLLGYNSFVVLSEGRIIASCGGPPLLIARGELASDASALIETEFLSLKAGDVVEIMRDDWTFLRGSPGTIFHRTQFMSDRGPEKKGFATKFMEEIWEQPRAMKTALNNDKEKLSRVCHLVQPNVVLAGAGSSKVACMWAKFKFMEAGVNAEVVPVGEWLSRPIPETRAVIAVSQSGETGTLVPLVDTIADRNTKLVAVVNTPWSYLARQSTEVLQLFCGEERSVIASKSFIAQCVVLGQVAGYVDNSIERFEEIVGKASSAVANWLPKLQLDIENLNIQLERCFVCGEGEFYPVAHEAAMKLKEGAYVFAEPMVGSEFKHEALPLVTPGETVFWVGETHSGGIAQVAEIRARGAQVIGVSLENWGFDVHIEMPPEAVSFPPIAIVPFQLLTQWIAHQKKINVDRPRNLAKAITVK